jgi:hypothetical protein
MTRTLEELREYLVGEWLFDNDFLDTSGNGNHGTPTDIEWKPTARGLKPYFNGSSSYIDCQNQLTESNNITVSAWVYPNINEDGDKTILSQFSDDIYSGAYTLRYRAKKNGYHFSVWTDDIYVDAPIASGFLNGQWIHFVGTYDGSYIKLYQNGELVASDTLTGNINYDDDDGDRFVIGAREYNFPGTTWDGNIGEIGVYSTALTDDEVLALYESTKHAYGVVPAERSFTHRLQPEVDANTVAAFDMSTKNSDGTLMDLSGNSNHGDIQGAVRAGGYFTDGMMSGYGNHNIIQFNHNNDIDFSKELYLELIITIPDWTKVGSYTPVIQKTNEPNNLKNGFNLRKNSDNNKLTFSIGNSTNTSYEQTNVLSENRKYLIQCYYESGVGGEIWCDGEYLNSLSSIGDIDLNTEPINIFNRSDRLSDGQYIIQYAKIMNVVPTDSQIKSRFNSLANLPLYTFDASKYPTSSGWTANVPYSSMSISSGEFSFTDDGQLQCDSAGSFSLRNSHPFDADEYIKLTINGVEYAGTGSVTEGTVTVSLTQGSNKISVNMGTGDVIDGIDIQFREPVE